MANAKLNVNNCDISNRNGTQMVTNSITNNYNTDKKYELQLPFRYNLSNPVQNFCGRRAELKKLNEMLKNSPTILSQAITGLGGVGKTELAKEYAKEYGNDYGFVMFVVGENLSELTKTFYMIAEELNIKIETNVDKKEKLIPIKTVVDKIYSYCSKHGNTLVIIDNAEGPEDIIEFLPRDSSHKIHMLITSRRREWDLSDDHTNIGVLNLEVLTVKEAEQYIKESLKNDDLYNDEDIHRLSERLQRLPLALKQAAGYIQVQNKKQKLKRDPFTVAKYLELFEIQTAKLLEFQKPTDTYKKTVFTTWKITIEMIKSKYDDVGKHAAKLLEHMSYMFPDNILYEIIFKVKTNDLNNDAILLLDEYSMIDIDDRYLRIHRLVQDITRMEIDNCKESCCA